MNQRTTFTIDEKRGSITCHKCGLTSYNPNDVRGRYCGKCHHYHDFVTPEESLCQQFPMIDWRSPLPVLTSRGRFIACRFCIAMYGLSEQHADKLPRNLAEFQKHMQQQHPLT